jgi:hypothetical protein
VANYDWTTTNPPEGVCTCEADFYVYGTYLGTGQSQKTVSYASPNDLTRAQIKAEYAKYNVNLTPQCEDFSDARHPDHFSFNELNTGDYTVALIRDPLIVGSSTDGLEKWRSQYGSPMTVTSAYRNPARNQAVGGAAGSRHVFGDAADIATGGDHNVWNSLQTAAQNANADFIETTADACGWNCLHA